MTPARCATCGFRDFAGHAQHLSWCPLSERPEVKAEPSSPTLVAADDFTRGARFAALHAGAAEPTIAPLLSAAAHHRAVGEALGRQQATEVLEQVLTRLADRNGPAHYDVLRQVREHVAAELGRVGRARVVGGEG